MSRVPPARSARTGARAITFFMVSGPRLLEKCPPFRGQLGNLRPRRRGELRSEARDAGAELLERGAVQRVGRDRLQRQRVEPRAVVGNAVVEVRPGGEPGHADVADHVALQHSLARPHAFGEAGEVQVRRLHARGVADADEVPLARFVARLDDDAVRGRHHRRADGRAVVDAVMRPEGVQDGMETALREMRGDVRVLQRRAKELLAQRRAVAGVVAGAAVRRLLAEGLVRRAAVREARGDDGAVAEEVAAAEALADDDAERVVALQREEVDVPLENVDELLNELRSLARESQRFVQRRVDARGDRGLDFLHLHLLLADVEAAVAVADRVELAPADDLHLHAVDLAVDVVVEADDVAVAKAAEVDGFAELAVQHGALAATETAGDEDGVERVALFEGEEDGVLRQDVGRGRREVFVAEVRRRRRDRGGAERLLRGAGTGGGDQQGGGDDRKDGEIRSRPPHKPTQSIADGELLLHRVNIKNRGTETWGRITRVAISEWGLGRRPP